MKILDGKLAAENLKKQLKQEVVEISEKLNRNINSAIILVGDNAASAVYVKNKIKVSQQLGIETELIKLDDKVSENELLEIINTLNNNDQLDGFIVQLPLPKHIDENVIIEAISPDKDIDGFHPQNIGKIVLGLPTPFVPATPLGIIELMKFYDIQTKGKHVVVIGRSNIVGKPIANLLIQKRQFANATVTICHSNTENLEFYTKQADILIAAIGQPNFVKKEMIKQGAIVIDVGINRIKSDKTKSGWKLVGDVDFDDVFDKVSAITPVPGGVGAMTVVALHKNIIEAAKLKIKNR